MNAGVDILGVCVCVSVEIRYQRARTAELRKYTGAKRRQSDE